MAKDHPPHITSDAMDRRFELADKGRAFWLEYHLDAYHRVLLLPDIYSPLAVKTVETLGEKQGQHESYQKPLVLLTSAPVVRAPGVEWITVPQEELEGIISLYTMYEFTDKLIIVSYDQPYGRKLFNLLETGIAEVKVLLADILLGALHGKDAS